MDDHHRDGRKYPACSLDHVWLQRGNTTGHCSRCHETFEGVTLFDAHQTIGDDGRTVCADPRQMTVRGKPLRLVDGSWRGPAMPADVIAKRAAKSSPAGAGTE